MQAVTFAWFGCEATAGAAAGAVALAAALAVEDAAEAVALPAASPRLARRRCPRACSWRRRGSRRRRPPRRARRPARRGAASGGDRATARAPASGTFAQEERSRGSACAHPSFAISFAADDRLGDRQRDPVLASDGRFVDGALFVAGRLGVRLRGVGLLGTSARVRLGLGALRVGVDGVVRGGRMTCGAPGSLPKIGPGVVLGSSGMPRRARCAGS